MVRDFKYHRMISLGKENYSEQKDQSIFLNFTYIRMISLGKENYSEQKDKSMSLILDKIE